MFMQDKLLNGTFRANKRFVNFTMMQVNGKNSSSSILIDKKSVLLITAMKIQGVSDSIWKLMGKYIKS